MFLCGAKLRTPNAERRSLAWPCSARPALRPVPGHRLLTLRRHAAWRSPPLIGSSRGGQTLSYEPAPHPLPVSDGGGRSGEGSGPRLSRASRERHVPPPGVRPPLGGCGAPGGCCRDRCSGLRLTVAGQLSPLCECPGPATPTCRPSAPRSLPFTIRGPHVPPEGVLLVRRPTPCLHGVPRAGCPRAGARRRFPLPRRSLRKH